MFHVRSGSTGTRAGLRRAITAASRLATLAALVALAGCAAIKAIDNAIDPIATPLGDPSRPVMVQGQGAIAFSLEYSMPIQEFAQMGALITEVWLEPVGDNKKRIWFSNGRGVPSHYAKNLPHEAHVLAPRLYIHSLPPGKYNIKEVSVGADHRNLTGINIYDSPEITVAAGQLSYVGNFYIKYMTRFTSKGELVPRTASLSGPNNQFERDIRELKSAEQRLDKVTIVNTLQR